MKKLISFALWGTDKKYCHGAVINLDLAAQHYPGWTCRIYMGRDVPKKYRDEIGKRNCEIVGKKGYQGEKHHLNMFWRFEAMFDDPDVSRVIVRDTDSRIGAREAAAVREWEEIGSSFHIMRDCKQHGIHILGGTWGALPRKCPWFKKEMNIFFTNLDGGMKQNPKGPYHGYDQHFLCRRVWPHVKNICTAHDEFFHFTGRERKFPVPKLDGRYVGQP